MNEIVKISEKKQNLQRILEKQTDSFKMILGNYLKPEKLIKTIMLSAGKNPKLFDCDPMSIVSCAIKAAEVELVPDTAQQYCHIIPYWNGRKKCLEAQFQMGYRGLMELCYRGGEISLIRAVIVFKKDKYKIVEGLHPNIEHEPFLLGDRGEKILVYAVAEFKDPNVRPIFTYMTKEDVYKRRAVSQSYNAKYNDDSPWIKWEDEQWMKTAIKKLTGLLPKTDGLAKAIAIDNASEAGIDYQSGEIFDDNDMFIAPEKDDMAVKIIDDAPKEAVKETASNDNSNQQTRNRRTKEQIQFDEDNLASFEAIGAKAEFWKTLQKHSPDKKLSSIIDRNGWEEAIESKYQELTAEPTDDEPEPGDDGQDQSKMVGIVTGLEKQINDKKTISSIRERLFEESDFDVATLSIIDLQEYAERLEDVIEQKNVVGETGSGIDINKELSWVSQQVDLGHIKYDDFADFWEENLKGHALGSATKMNSSDKETLIEWIYKHRKRIDSAKTQGQTTINID